MLGKIIEPDGVTLNASDLIISLSPADPFPTINKEVTSPKLLYRPETCCPFPNAIVPIPSACE